MIIGKIMMVQNSSPVDSVDYLISKRAIELKDRIKNYSLNKFIDEIGVSKTSLVRYLKRIGITKFVHFKEIMYNEYMLAHVDMCAKKKNLKKDFTNKEKEFAEKLMKCNRVIILGDGNRFALSLVQKALIYYNISCEIPVYLGSEEVVIEEYGLTEDDLVILVSLHESFDSFLLNRSLFYRDTKYLRFITKTKLAFIGVSGYNQSKDLYFEYNINEKDFALKIAELEKLFMNACDYILLNSDVITI